MCEGCITALSCNFSAFNDSFVCEADSHSSEWTLAQQILIVRLEGSKEGWKNACFSQHKRAL